MVSIVINGKRSPREFQNMAMALSFAVNNGDCRNAERLEIAYAVTAAAVKKDPPAGSAETGTTGSTPPPVPGPAGTGGGKK